MKCSEKNLNSISKGKFYTLLIFLPFNSFIPPKSANKTINIGNNIIFKLGWRRGVCVFFLKTNTPANKQNKPSFSDNSQKPLLLYSQKIML